MEKIIGFISIYVIMICLNKAISKLINWLVKIFKRLFKKVSND